MSLEVFIYVNSYSSLGKFRIVNEQLFFCFSSIDATHVHGYAKMVNDSPDKLANSFMRRVVVNNESVHICLFAKCNITAGTEIR